MQTKTFQKNKEDFICEKCGYKNIGNGYTNHCSQCLYSKHVDINPGDRKETCNSLMKPIEVLNKNGETYIKHKCQKCGFERNNKISSKDNFDAMIKISSDKNLN